MNPEVHAKCLFSFERRTIRKPKYMHFSKPDCYLTPALNQANTGSAKLISE